MISAQIKKIYKKEWSILQEFFYAAQIQVASSEVAKIKKK